MDQYGICGESVFAAFFKEHVKPLRNYLYFKYGDTDQADDITQDAFVKLWENCANVPLEKAKSFLYTVANNASLNQIAHKKVVLKHAQSVSPADQISVDAEYVMEEAEFEKKLEAAINRLTEAQRTAFLLNRIEKKKYHEIAEMLGISVKAVEKRIHGALVSLRAELGTIR